MIIQQSPLYKLFHAGDILYQNRKGLSSYFLDSPKVFFGASRYDTITESGSLFIALESMSLMRLS